MVKRRPFPPETPWLVAAIDYNHCGKLSLARRLVAQAVAAGAHAVKIAVRENAVKGTPELQGSSWPTADNLGVQREKCWKELELTPRGLSAVRREARGRLAFVAAPHDLAALKSARALNPDVYQIDASALGDLPLVRAIGRTRRPVLLVAGTCTEARIAAALKELGDAVVVIMHTVTAVPLEPVQTRLGFIQTFRKRYKRQIGYLGWEHGGSWSLVAAALGAVVIEKPLTIDKNLDGPLHTWSLNPDEFGVLARNLRDMPEVLKADQRRSVFPEELAGRADVGHSLVAKRRLSRGTRLRSSHFVVRAPMGGLSPRLLSWVEGRRLLYDVEAGEPITFGLVE